MKLSRAGERGVIGSLRGCGELGWDFCVCIIPVMVCDFRVHAPVSVYGCFV